MPAYATAIGEAPNDVEPVDKTKRGRRAPAKVGEDAGEQLSKEEFDELVREIGPELAEQKSGLTPASVGSKRGRTAKATKSAPPAHVNGAEQLNGDSE